ncbi:IclR family transcriptional regulator [Enterobacterales bacterium BD_CKDN230030183-1A_HGKHYDSX7]
MQDQEKSGGIQVIARAAAIMRTLGDHPKGLSLAGIAREVDLARSTVQRIINALVDERLVEPLGPGGGFRLGSALGQLLNRTQSDIISVVGPIIEAASDRMQETVILASLVGDKVFISYCAVAQRELRIVFPVGMHAPAHATAVGKIFLAQLPDEALSNLLPAQLESHTPMTLDRATLLQEIPQVRADQYAIDEEEYIEGISALAVPVYTYLGNYAVAILAPSTRASRRKQEYVQALKGVKAEIEKNIGSVLV